ncbi:MAG: hypothetical protein ABI777_06335 [Betaproteobacteria bacterium]
MKDKHQRDNATRPSPSAPPPADPAPAVTGIAQRAALEVGGSVFGRIYMLLAALMMSFASVFLLVGWQFGPLVMVQAHQYRQMTGRVDARIVESWLALEFDAGSVRVPEFWRASTNASRCVVAEYGGEWGAPLRRAFCGTRVPFNDSYLLADLRDISPDVAFAWPRDERGFVVPEIRMAVSTREWLAAHTANKFMHQQWPANTELDWLRLELDRPVDAATWGWTAPASVLPLAFDPARPAEALPTGLVERRMAQRPNWIAVAVGLVVGIFVWFKAMSLLPLLQNMAPAGRWILSALPLLTLPWWMDYFPRVLTYFSREMATVVGDMFADVAKTDRVVASAPAEATLAGGERMVWRFGDSVYADTMGRFTFVQPKPAPATQQAALDALIATVTTQARTLREDERDALVAHLDRDQRRDLTRVLPLFGPMAKAVATDPAAPATTRRIASQLLQ